ncbi:uncharacterized protein [Setaria viridis]|uniref:uncharacterized protein isoform X2 n=1 Tax=Setaria viridis TaxID=4556 RepID=UPI0014934A93|nr:uncharacterized protein LOC117840847 isoform X2 [Setaria viridis]
MSKRRGDYSSSSNEKQKANKSHGNFDLDDSSHKEFDSLDAEVELHTEVVQKLSESVVSLSFIGKNEHYQYTGLVIKSNKYSSCFLTSATAIRCKQGGRNRNMDLLIHVNLPDGQMMRGTFVVGQASCCRASIKQGSDNQIERSTSEICKSSTLVVLNSEEKGRGSDKSPETNQKSSVSSTSDSESESSQDTSELSNSPLPDNEFMKAFTNDLLSRGYPLPKMLEGGMELRKNFEEEFAGDIWNRLTKKVALDTSLSVVSLASFRGETRFFACTGVLIGRHKSITRILTSASLVRFANKNEIDGSLKIRVLLPNKKHATGKLQHHNLHYNIAVVSIRNFHCRRIAKLHIEKPVYPLNDNQVVAIGRTFDTGKLMATSGVLTDNSSNLVSEEHGICTCKITKAGIGGPLIDFCGNFIGMNFYDAKRTPYLPRHIILEQLKDFDRKGSAAAKINEDGDPNRFSVPGPYWWYPSLAPRFIYERRRKH